MLQHPDYAAKINPLTISAVTVSKGYYAGGSRACYDTCQWVRWLFQMEYKKPYRAVGFDFARNHSTLSHRYWQHAEVQVWLAGGKQYRSFACESNEQAERVKEWWDNAVSEFVNRPVCKLALTQTE
jgi:hypothetical protein